MGTNRTRIGDFDIDLQLVDVTNALDRRLFAEAAQSWMQVVVGDLDSRTTDNAPEVPPTGCTYPNVIDDVYICVSYAAIDGTTVGSGNVLAESGPIWIRKSNSLPVAGFMKFDKSDVPALRANNGLANVIQHEMAHVLGFGTLWDKVGILSLSLDKKTCFYLGPLANAEYQALSGCASAASIPLELKGGSGSGSGPVCMHWDEDCLRTELMTPSYNEGIVNGLSRMTIASLQDLGYNVSYRTAQPWTNADLGDSCVCRRGRRRSTAATKRRLPSAAAQQAAVDYGQSNLRSNALSMSEDSTSRGGNDDLVYVGDKVISILFEEHGALHSVVVTN
jgi:Leishmanolysin